MGRLTKVLKKRLSCKPQSDRATARLDSRYHHSALLLVTVISDEGIGEMDCPKSPQQSNKRNK